MAAVVGALRAQAVEAAPSWLAVLEEAEGQAEGVPLAQVPSSLPAWEVGEGQAVRVPLAQAPSFLGVSGVAGVAEEPSRQDRLALAVGEALRGAACCPGCQASWAAEVVGGAAGGAAFACPIAMSRSAIGKLLGVPVGQLRGAGRAGNGLLAGRRGRGRRRIARRCPRRARCAIRCCGGRLVGRGCLAAAAYLGRQCACSAAEAPWSGPCSALAAGRSCSASRRL